ncbi:MAG: hypothetical protein R6V12_01205 [Candidatus Hydrogenedentota bacterium]
MQHLTTVQKWGSWGFPILLTFALVSGFEASGAEQDVLAGSWNVERSIPHPFPGHPGNVFLAQETVVIDSRPEGIWTRFRVLDDGGETIVEGAYSPDEKSLSLGELPVGWYRIEFSNENGEVEASTTAAVLAPLPAPVPPDSPVCLDTAMAWFARNNVEKQRNFASLAALAGVNWSRDRMNWGDMQTAQEIYADPGCNYDSSAYAAAGQGLNVLQVFHRTPSWIVQPELDGEEPGKRFPRDLRDLYRFCKAMAVRYKGWVQAWEPWNEANINGFGGHLINEMCSLQKAAYWALKSGDPEVIVCWNVFAGSGGRFHTEGVLKNETWPYYETYNIHTYNAPAAYLESFAGPREATCGKPIWLTECGIRLHTEDAPPWGDLPLEDEIRQAEFIAQSYASSLYAGVDRHFFFILGNYIERGIQFGVLRHDLTPRPGYVALAAVGRMLAGAEPLGRRLLDKEAAAWAYAFRAKHGQGPVDLVIAWAEKPFAWQLPFKVKRAYDYLGREITGEKSAPLTSKPVFLVTPENGLAGLEVEPPPPISPPRQGTPCPVVLQVELPVETVRLGPQAYELPAGTDIKVPIWVYNFGETGVSGALTVEKAPRDWQTQLSGETIEIAAMERRKVPLDVRMPTNGDAMLYGDWLHVHGDFGADGKPVVAFRLIGDRETIEPTGVTSIPGARDSARWADNAVGDATLTHRATEDGTIAFSVTFGEMDPWAYPRLNLDPGERPAASDTGIALGVNLLDGEGTMRVQFVEDTGAAYVATLPPSYKAPGWHRVSVLFRDARWGAHSRPDPDEKLQPERIVRVLVGINAQRNTKVRFAVRDLAWVRY